MAERHDEEREIAQAHARLTQITEELSRRTTPEYLKAKARERADEMSGRAKVMARERTIEMKDRLLDSPWALGLLGGAVGAIAGKLIGDRTRDRHAHGGYEFYEEVDAPYDEYTATHRYPATAYGEQGYGEGYGSYGHYGSESVQSDTIITDDPMYGLDVGERGDRMEGFRESASSEEHGIKDKARDLKHKASERARDLKHKASERMSDVGERARDLKHKGTERASHLGDSARESGHGLRSKAGHMASGIRDHIPSGHQMKSGMRRVGNSTHERPELWGIAAVAIGALFGSLMPITSKERRYLGPVKSDAQDRISAAKDEVIDRAKGFKKGMEGGLGLSDESGEQSEDSRGIGNGQFREEGELAGRSDLREREPRSPAVEQTSLSTSPEGGSVGGYGSDTGFSGETQTYTAGGTNEDENRQQGFQPVADPDVTRH